MNEKRRKTLKNLAVLLWVILALCVGWIVFDQTVDRSGWVEKDGQYSYRDFHGRRITGWLELGDKTYFLNNDRIMVTGWQKIGSKHYYFAGDGVMATGWRNVDDKRCYFDPDGAMHIGWLELDAKRYYLDENGAMVSGWQELDNETYYFGENGAMLSGWNRIAGNTYYFGEIDVAADREGDILGCRERGFATLEQQPDYLSNKVIEGSYGEFWSLRKVLRRFIWHDRIHARAMWRMGCRTFPKSSIADPFHFGE